MTKEKVYIEKMLNSKSKNMIWPLISDASGLARWMADDVQDNHGHLTFRWGEEWTHHDIHTATVLESVENEYFRFKWDADGDADTYVELRMDKSDLTGQYMLCITDFAHPEDIDSLRGLWEDDLDRLHHATGL